MRRARASKLFGMLAMWMLRSLTTPLLGTCLLLSSLAPARAEAPSGGGLSIGSTAEVDTHEVRRLIETAKGSTEADEAETTPFVLTLEEAIRIALEGNLQLQIAAIDRDVADALVPAARAKFHPTPGFDVAANGERLVDAPDDISKPGELVPGTYSQTGQAAVPFVRQELPTAGTLTITAELLRRGIQDDTDVPPDQRAKNGDNYLGGTSIILRQPLLRGGSVYVARREILDAEYNQTIAESQLRAQILQVTASVKESYYNTILARRLIEVSEEALKRDRALLQASEALFQAGRASRRDVLSAQIRISDDEASLASNRAAFGNSQLVLRNVLGTPIERPVLPAAETVPFDPVEIRLARWLTEAVENRPEIQLLMARLDQTALAVKVAENDVLPALDFLGGYTRAGFSGSSRTTWDLDSQAFTAALHFEIPIGNVAARERLRAAKLLNERVERELRNQQRQIEIEVRTQVIKLRENLGQVAAQTAKLEQAREKRETASTRFRLGLANNFDVTDAEDDVVSAETQFLSSMVDYVNSQARLEASIAGPL